MLYPIELWDLLQTVTQKKTGAKGGRVWGRRFMMRKTLISAINDNYVSVSMLFDEDDFTGYRGEDIRLTAQQFIEIIIAILPHNAQPISLPMR